MQHDAETFIYYSQVRV